MITTLTFSLIGIAAVVALVCQIIKATVDVTNRK